MTQQDDVNKKLVYDDSLSGCGRRRFFFLALRDDWPTLNLQPYTLNVSGCGR